MRIALVADTYPPLRTSGAVQLRDLAGEFRRQDHNVTVMVPAPEQREPWILTELNGVPVLQLAAPRTKDIPYVRRTIGELVMPFAMLRNLRKSPLASVRWDGVVWYSPSIFLGPMAKALKCASGCGGYLILRDIFPEWAADIGKMRRGWPLYWFFKRIEQYQYAVADTIGVQTPANLAYLKDWARLSGRRLEVLQNWLAYAPNIGTSLMVTAGPLAGRTIFVYAGNMGVAQGMDLLLDLAERLRERRDLGFLFVGRGSEASRLQDDAARRRLDHVVFHDELEPWEIPGLLAQCHIGLITLDPRHQTHNIPGKFLTYLQAGLPVLAAINRGNDLGELITREEVGRVCVDHSLDTLQRLALELADDRTGWRLIAARCRALFLKQFSPVTAVQQIVAALI